MFAFVREGWPDSAAVTTNLAHIHLLEGNTAKAITLYSYVARRFGAPGLCIAPGAAGPVAPTGGKETSTAVSAVSSTTASPTSWPPSSESVRSLLALAKAHHTAQDFVAAADVIKQALM